MKKDKLPNFLVVGAAKSGTTSLYYYLEEHPEIFMSKLKEPKFITSQFLSFPFGGDGDDIIEKGMIKNFNDYKNLFNDVCKEKVIGEASADLLYYSENSIPIIKEKLGDTKIIVILRNPIDRAFSHYSHFIRDGREKLTFENALMKEDERIRENWIFGWHYKEVGLYYKQVKNYMDNFKEVKVYLYEDLRGSSGDLIKDIYQFLEVDTSFVPSDMNVKYNASGIPSNTKLHYFLTRKNLIKTVLSPLKKVLPMRKLRIAVEHVKNRNLTKTSMLKKTREELVEYYTYDIENLQKLIGRDLSHWLQ